ncbi:MAG: hypothetical protein QXH92_05125 [Candidatus Aenigmatarchaeota archaeon]
MLNVELVQTVDLKQYLNPIGFYFRDGELRSLLYYSNLLLPISKKSKQNSNIVENTVVLVECINGIPKLAIVLWLDVPDKLNNIFVKACEGFSTYLYNNVTNLLSRIYSNSKQNPFNKDNQEFFLLDRYFISVLLKLFSYCNNYQHYSSSSSLLSNIIGVPQWKLTPSEPPFSGFVLAFENFRPLVSYDAFLQLLTLRNSIYSALQDQCHYRICTFDIPSNYDQSDNSTHKLDKAIRDTVKKLKYIDKLKFFNRGSGCDSFILLSIQPDPYLKAVPVKQLKESHLIVFNGNFIPNIYDCNKHKSLTHYFNESVFESLIINPRFNNKKLSKVIEQEIYMLRWDIASCAESLSYVNTPTQAINFDLDCICSDVSVTSTMSFIPKLRLTFTIKLPQKININNFHYVGMLPSATRFWWPYWFCIFTENKKVYMLLVPIENVINKVNFSEVIDNYQYFVEPYVVSINCKLSILTIPNSDHSAISLEDNAYLIQLGNNIDDTKLFLSEDFMLLFSPVNDNYYFCLLNTAGTENSGYAIYIKESYLPWFKTLCNGLDKNSKIGSFTSFGYLTGPVRFVPGLYANVKGTVFYDPILTIYHGIVNCCWDNNIEKYTEYLNRNQCTNVSYYIGNILHPEFDTDLSNISYSLLSDEKLPIFHSLLSKDIVVFSFVNNPVYNSSKKGQNNNLSNVYDFVFYSINPSTNKRGNKHANKST